MTKQTVLTKQEIEEIKDEAVFRSIMRLHIKEMAGLPKKVNTLEVKVALIVWGIPIVIGIAGLVMRLLK